MSRTPITQQQIKEENEQIAKNLGVAWEEAHQINDASLKTAIENSDLPALRTLIQSTVAYTDEPQNSYGDSGHILLGSYQQDDYGVTYYAPAFNGEQLKNAIDLATEHNWSRGIQTIVNQIQDPTFFYQSTYGRMEKINISRHITALPKLDWNYVENPTQLINDINEKLSTAEDSYKTQTRDTTYAEAEAAIANHDTEALTDALKSTHTLIADSTQSAPDLEFDDLCALFTTTMGRGENYTKSAQTIFSYMLSQNSPDFTTYVEDNRSEIDQMNLRYENDRLESTLAQATSAIDNQNIEVLETALQSTHALFVGSDDLKYDLDRRTLHNLVQYAFEKGATASGNAIIEHLKNKDNEFEANHHNLQEKINEGLTTYKKDFFESMPALNDTDTLETILKITQRDLASDTQKPLLQSSQDFNNLLSSLDTSQERDLAIRILVRHLVVPTFDPITQNQHTDSIIHHTFHDTPEIGSSMSLRVIKEILDSQGDVQMLDDSTVHYLKLAQSYLKALKVEALHNRNPMEPAPNRAQRSILNSIRTARGDFNNIDIENPSEINAFYYGANQDNPAELLPYVDAHKTNDHPFINMLSIGYGYKLHLSDAIEGTLKKAGIVDEKRREFMHAIEQHPEHFECTFEGGVTQGNIEVSNHADPTLRVSLQGTLFKAKAHRSELNRALKKYKKIADYTNKVENAAHAYKNEPAQTKDELLHSKLKPALKRDLNRIEVALEKERTGPLYAFVKNMAQAIKRLAHRVYHRTSATSHYSLFGSHGSSVTSALRDELPTTEEVNELEKQEKENTSPNDSAISDNGAGAIVGSRNNDIPLNHQAGNAASSESDEVSSESDEGPTLQF